MFSRLGQIIGYFSDSRSRTLIAVLICALAFGSVEVVFHEIFQLINLPFTGLVLLDAVTVGASGGFAVWMLLQGNRERRASVRRELERISELNHEIRNALQIITHSHFDADAGRREMVLDSVTRIDAVLRRLFPVVGGDIDHKGR